MFSRASARMSVRMYDTNARLVATVHDSSHSTITSLQPIFAEALFTVTVTDGKFRFAAISFEVVTYPSPLWVDKLDSE